MIFREVLTIMRRWLWLIALGTVLGGLLAYAAYLRAPELFRTSAGVILVKRDFQVNLEPRFQTTTDNSLISLKEGDAGLRPLASVVSSEAIAGSVFNDLEGQKPASVEQPTDLLNMISSEVKDGIIRVIATAHDPAFAAKLANAWANRYATYVNRIYSGKSLEMNLEPAVTEAQKNYQEAVAQLADFTRLHDTSQTDLEIAEKEAILDEILRSRRETLTGKLGKLNQRRTRTETILADAQALKNLVEKGESTTTNTANTLSLLFLQFSVSDTMGTALDTSTTTAGGNELQFVFNPQRLEEIASTPDELERDLDRLILTLTKRLQDYDQQIAEISKVIAGANKLEQDPLLNSLLSQLRTLRADNQILVSQQQDLTRQRDLMWDSYTLVANEAKELQISSGASDGALVRFAIPASLQRTPVKGNGVRTLVLGVIMGAVLSTALAFVLEMLDDKVRRREDVEMVLQLPVLGLAPRSAATKGNDLAIFNQSTVPMVETARALRSRLEPVSTTPITLLFTAASPQAGTSTLVANLAAVTAQSGRSVILIDANLRSPQQHTLFKISNSIGLTDLLADPARTIDNALQTTSVSGLRLLTSGPLGALSPDLLSSQRMLDILAQIHGMADIVLIDTAAAGAVTDAVALVGATNGVILVLRSGVSAVGDVQHLRGAIEAAQGHILGVVLNHAPDVKASGQGAPAAVGSVVMAARSGE